MDDPGVGIPSFFSSEQIAIGRVGIDTHQDQFVAMEDFVMHLGGVLQRLALMALVWRDAVLDAGAPDNLSLIVVRYDAL